MVPTYAMMLVIWLSPLSILPSKILWSLVGVVFVFTGVIPMSAIFALYRTGKISDTGLNNRTERTVPYVIVTICYLACSFLFFRMQAPMWLTMFFAGAAAAAVVNITVNRWWKISAHAAALGGVVAILFRLVTLYGPSPTILIWISVATVVTGLVMSSRVYMQRHTLMQVLAGVANGYLCVWFLSAIH